jgi:hypothetical protein
MSGCEFKLAMHRVMHARFFPSSIGGSTTGIYGVLRMYFPVSGHTTQSAPALIRTPKLSWVGLG